MVKLAAALFLVASCGGAVSPPKPTEISSLAVDPGAACVSEGSTVAVQVTIARGPAAPDPVVVSVDAPDFVSASPLVLAAPDTSGLLVLGVTPDAPEGPVSVTVHAADATQVVTVTVGPPAGSVDMTATYVVAAAVQPNALVVRQGNAFVVGESTHGSDVEASGAHLSSVLVRFDESGRRDPTFGASDGVVSLEGDLSALGVRADGSLLAGFAQSTGTDVAILSPDGRTRSDLAPQKQQVGAWAVPRTVLEAPDGSIYTCGPVWDCCGYATRRTPLGALDLSFGQSGSVMTKPYLNSARACALAPDGSLAVGVYQGLQDLDATGALVFDDASHGNVQNPDPDVDAVVVAGDGTIYTQGSDLKVRAIEPDGSQDASFSVHTCQGTKPLGLMLRRDGLVALSDKQITRLGFDGQLTAELAAPFGATAMTQDACGRIVVASYEPVAMKTPPTARVVLRRYWP